MAHLCVTVININCRWNEILVAVGVALTFKSVNEISNCCNLSEKLLRSISLLCCLFLDIIKCSIFQFSLESGLHSSVKREL